MLKNFDNCFHGKTIIIQKNIFVKKLSRIFQKLYEQKSWLENRQLFGGYYNEMSRGTKDKSLLHVNFYPSC